MRWHQHNFLKEHMNTVVSRVIWWGKDIIHKNWRTGVRVKFVCNANKSNLAHYKQQINLNGYPLMRNSYSWVSLRNSPMLDGIEPVILLFLNTLQEKEHYNHKNVWLIENIKR